MDDESNANPFAGLRHTSRFLELWQDRASFSTAFSLAAQITFRALSTSSRTDATAFMDNIVVRLVSSARVLSELCTMLGDVALTRAFLRYFIRHELLDYDVLFELIESPDVFHSLPHDSDWAEVAVLLYGSEKLNRHRGTSLTIAEIVPLGLEVERSTVRSLIGS